MSIASDGKILMWPNPMKHLRYPIKGHTFARAKNNQLSIFGAASMDIIPGGTTLEEQAFVVGTESGLVQKCLIQKP